MGNGNNAGPGTNNDSAQVSEDAINKLIDAINKMSLHLGVASTSGNQFASMLGRGVREAKEHLEEAKARNKALEESIQDVQNAYEAGVLTTDALESALGSLRSQIDGVADATTRAELKRKKQDLEYKAAMANMVAGISKAGDNFGTTLNKIGAEFGNVIANAARHGDAIGASGEAMAAGVKLLQGGAESAFGGLSKFGKGLAAGGSKFGAVLGAVSGALANTATVMGAILATGISVMTQATRTYVSDFQKLADAGLTYSKGLDGLLRDTAKARISMGDFAAGIASNTDQLAAAGMGMSGASAVIMAGIQKDSNKFTEHMIALGYSMQDQVGLMGDVMAGAAMATGKYNLTNRQLSDATSAYATNLRTLSELTGKSVQSLREKAKADQEDLAMQQMFARKYKGEQLASVKAWWGQLAPEMKRAIEQKQFSGTVTDSSFRIADIQAHGALMQQVDQLSSAIGRGSAALDLMTIQQKNAANIQRNTLNSSKAFTTAAIMSPNGPLGAAFKILGSEFVKSASTAKEKPSDVQKKYKALMDQQNSAVVNVVNASRQMAATIQGVVADNLNKFAEGLKEITKVITESIKTIGGHPGGTAAAVFAGSLIGPIIGSAVGGVLSKKLGGILDKVLSRGGTAAAGAAGEAGAAAAGGEIGAIAKDLEQSAPGVGKATGALGKLTEVAKGFASGIGPAIKGAMKGVAEGISYFGNTEVLKGTGVIALAIADLWGLSYVLPKVASGLMSFAKVTWGEVAKGGVAIGGVIAGIALAGAAAEEIALGSLALVAAAFGLEYLGKGIMGFLPAVKQFSTVDWGSVVQGAGSLGLLGLEAAGAAIAGPIAWVGLKILGSALNSFGEDIKPFISGMNSLIRGPVLNAIKSGEFASLAKFGTELAGFMSNLPYIKMKLFSGGLTDFGRGLTDLSRGLRSLEGLDLSKLDKVAASAGKLEHLSQGRSVVGSVLGKASDLVSGALSESKNYVKGVYDDLVDHHDKKTTQIEHAVASHKAAVAESGGGKQKEDPLTRLVALQQLQLDSANKMLKVMKDQNDAIDKLLKVSS